MLPDDITKPQIYATNQRVVILQGRLVEKTEEVHRRHLERENLPSVIKRSKFLKMWKIK